MFRKMIVLILIAGAGVTAFSLSPREWIEQAQNLVDIEGQESLNRMILKDGRGNQRIREIYMMTGAFEGITKTLMRFTAPADIKGSAILTWDQEKGEDDMWLYLPALGKVRRIASGEKAKTFMGSEFTYIDLSQPDLDDFRYEDLGAKSYKGQEYQVIRIVPKDRSLMKEYGFSQRDVYLDPEKGIMVKAEYTDLRGRLERTLEILEIRLLADLGKYRAFNLAVTNHQTKRSSEMQLGKFKLNTDIPEEAFNPQSLDR